MLTKDGERWVLPLAGRQMEQCLVDFAFTLRLEGDFEIRIEGPLSFTDSSDVRHDIDPNAEPVLMGPLLGVGRDRVTGATTTTSGVLDLRFDNGSEIHVGIDDFEAWGLVGPGGLRVIALPGGELAIWHGEEGAAGARESGS